MSEYTFGGYWRCKKAITVRGKPLTVMAFLLFI